MAEGDARCLSLSLYTKLNILSLSQHWKIDWGPEVTPTPQTITKHGILLNPCSKNYIEKIFFFSGLHVLIHFFDRKSTKSLLGTLSHSKCS